MFALALLTDGISFVQTSIIPHGPELRSREAITSHGARHDVSSDRAAHAHLATSETSLLPVERAGRAARLKQLRGVFDESESPMSSYTFPTLGHSPVHRPFRCMQFMKISNASPEHPTRSPRIRLDEPAGNSTNPCTSSPDPDLPRTQAPSAPMPDPPSDLARLPA